MFVDHFRQIVPLYMVKHYVKPGITGLAQIKGFRGDTSIEARIHEDIEYIENWSFWLDLMILLKTPLKAFNKNEKYVNAKGEEGVVEEPELPTPIVDEPIFSDPVAPMADNEGKDGEQVSIFESDLEQKVAATTTETNEEKENNE